MALNRNVLDNIVEATLEHGFIYLPAADYHDAVALANEGLVEINETMRNPADTAMRAMRSTVAGNDIVEANDENDPRFIVEEPVKQQAPQPTFNVPNPPPLAAAFGPTRAMAEPQHAAPQQQATSQDAPQEAPHYTLQTGVPIPEKKVFGSPRNPATNVIAKAMEDMPIGQSFNVPPAKAGEDVPRLKGGLVSLMNRKHHPKRFVIAVDPTGQPGARIWRTHDATEPLPAPVKRSPRKPKGGEATSGATGGPAPAGFGTGAPFAGPQQGQPFTPPAGPQPAFTPAPWGGNE